MITRITQPFGQVMTSCLLLVLAAGCGPKFDGSFTFLNSSDTVVDDVKVFGFQRNPPCGYLGKGQEMTKTAYMGPMSLPEKVTLKWRFEGQKEQSTELKLPPKALKATEGELRFEIGRDKKWTLTLQESQHIVSDLFPVGSDKGDEEKPAKSKP